VDGYSYERMARKEEISMMKIQRIPLTLIGGYDAQGKYVSVRTAPIGDMMYIIVMRDAEIVLQSLVTPTGDDDEIASLIVHKSEDSK
jgi:hypothetical protein